MRHIVILSILFALLVAAVVKKEVSRPEAGALRDQVALRGLGSAPFTAADVLELEIRGPGLSDSFRIQKDGDRWLVLDPFRAPASTGVVAKLIETLASARAEERLDDPAKLASFDLSDDRGVGVILRGASGDLASVLVGRSSGQNGAFVRLRHSPELESVAYFVSRDLRSVLGLARTPAGESTPTAPQPETFYDMGVAPLALAGVERIELTSPRWHIVMAKTGPEWSVIQGAADLPLKPSGVQALLSQLGGGLQAKTLVDPARRADLGLDAAPYRVTAVLADGTRRSAVGAADRDSGTFFARLDVEQDPDVVYECAKYPWDRLFPTGGSIFDLPTLDVVDDGLGRILITSPKGVLDLRRPDGRSQSDWTVHSPNWPLEPRNELLRSLPSLLRSLRPVDFVDGPAELETEITIAYGAHGVADDELRTIRVGAKPAAGSDRIAILPDNPSRLMALAGDSVERLIPDPLSLFETRLMDGWERDAITRIAVSAAGVEQFALVQGEREWTLVRDGVEGPSKGLRVTRFVDELLELEVTAIAASPSSAGQSVTVERKEGEPLTFVVHDSDDGGLTLVLGGHAFTVDGASFVPDAESLVGAPAPESVPDEDAPGTPGDDE